MSDTTYVVRFEAYKVGAWRPEDIIGFDHVGDARAAEARLREAYGDDIRNIQIFRREVTVTETVVPDSAVTELINKAKSRYELFNMAGEHNELRMDRGEPIDKGAYRAMIHCAQLIPDLIKALENRTG